MKKTLMSVLAFGLLAQGNLQARDNTTFGVVNFTNCVSESKYGKKEQENFENLRNQVTSMIEESQKELQDLSEKIQDPDFLDGLSPKAEEELKQKFQTKNQDFSRIQNQYYQVLQQANMQVMQKLNDTVARASESVAQKKNLGVIMNKEACFYYKPALDMTNLVISEMDKNFDKDEAEKKISENQEALKSNSTEPEKKAS